MEYRPLGRTGIHVSKLCLGTMMFGAWGNTDHDDSIRIIHRALDTGINFVDTADVYSAGESEEIVGKALKDRRDDVILATKFWGPMGEDRNRRGVSRRWIITEVENSLRRLGTDWIDVQSAVVHPRKPGPRTPSAMRERQDARHVQALSSLAGGRSAPSASRAPRFARRSRPGHALPRPRPDDGPDRGAQTRLQGSCRRT
jgi:aryl-alcohol dehydrogenase-like predicted oxidoreductase